MKKLAFRIIVAILAALFFSLLFSLASRSADAQAGYDFPTIFGTYVIVSLPMFLVVGVVVSMVLDQFAKITSWQPLLYALAGGLLILPYTTFIFGFTPIFMMFGASAGIIYYFLKRIGEKLFPQLAS